MSNGDPGAQGYYGGAPAPPAVPDATAYPPAPVQQPMPTAYPNQAYPAQPQVPTQVPNPQQYVQPTAQPVGQQPYGAPGQPYAPPAPQPIPQQPTQPAGPLPMPTPAGLGASVGSRPIPVGPGGAMPGAGAGPAEGEEELDQDLTLLLKNSPPWLISTIVHMLLLIILGLWMFANEAINRLDLEATYAEKLGEQVEFENLEPPSDDDVLLEEPVLTPDNLPPVEDPFAEPPKVDVNINAITASNPVEASVVGLALTGREKGMKQALLSAYGGTATTETAVFEGLKWLARNQQRDGSWSLSGPYAGGASAENETAATAMALLAFQGAGHTHKSGDSSPFVKNVERGWNWLIKQQNADGDFFRQGPAHHRLYTQAQCTIALCELYGMTKDPAYYEPAQRAVAYALKIQDRQGGWRYTPGSDSDTSVTGWFVMALQSAKMAGFEVPQAKLDNIMDFFDRAQIDGGRQYLYKPGAHGGPAMTAEGLLCRQYLGWKHDDPRLVGGADYLANHVLNWNDRNAYYWYYATQVCHHMEGKHWRKWNAVMRQMLPEKQEKQGKERGSWSPDMDRWGAHGGRLFVTCLHVYMLEVYYRHLPIYKYNVFVAAEKDK